MKRNCFYLLIIFLFLSFINIDCYKNYVPDCDKWEVNDNCRCTCLTSPCCLQSGVHQVTLCGDENKNTVAGRTETIVGSCSKTDRTYIRKL
jgi:hypothetical protein